MDPTNSSSPPSTTAASTAAAAASSSAAAATATAAAAASSRSTTTIDQHLAQTIQTLDQLTTIFGFPHHIAKEAIDECGPENVTLCYNWILDHRGNEVQDSGGPVVPRTDCPHVEHHVRLCVDGKQMRILDERDGGGGSTTTSVLNRELQRYCVEGNLMTSDCQHNSVKMTRTVSRKRLRSEDNITGRLKCEEDYDMDHDENGNEKGENNNKSSSSCPKGENWLCLECGALLCSRYANGHAKMHHEDTKEEGRAAVTASMKGSGEYAPHGAEEGHCVAVSLADLSVWCYECNAYLRHPDLDALTKHLEELKFGRDESENNGGDDGRAADEAEEGDAKLDEMEVDKQSNGIGDEMKTEVSNHQTAGTANDENGKDKMPQSTSKRKGAPRKLPPEQIGKTLLSGQQHTQQSSPKDDGSDDKSNDGSSEDNKSDNDSDDDEDDNDDNSSSSSSSVDDHQAALIASLLQSEHGNAIRAYLARHESFDTSNLGQCVPMPNLPKPPSFPDEMADYLRSPLCKSIVVLAGAGMSVSSGIPDFRSAGVGLYDTLRPELLTATELERALIEDDPTLALDKGMFLQNPLPMLETKRSFILGTYEKRWKATLAHRFVELLHTKLGKLTRLYTQNIDGLEMQTNLPKEKVVCVHGSMGASACEHCGEEADFDDFCSKVRSNIKDITGQDKDAPVASTPIYCEKCENPTVKPTIVLFRGSMPTEFHVRTAEDLPDADLLIIMGTSLTVAPANSLVYRIPPTALRMVMNNERVGRRLGIDYSENSIRDVWAHGYTDESCLNLCEKMGWLDDLALTMDDLPDSSAQLLRERLAQRQREGQQGQIGDEDESTEEKMSSS